MLERQTAGYRASRTILTIFEEENVKDSYDDKLLAIDDIFTIIDKLQEYAKCGLAANGRSHYTAKIWADKVRAVLTTAFDRQKTDRQPSCRERVHAMD